MIEFKQFRPKIEYETTGNDTFRMYIKFDYSYSEYDLVYNITKGKSISWSKSNTGYGSALSNSGGLIWVARNNTRIKINEKPVTAWTSVLFHPMLGEYGSSCNNNI